MKKSLIAALVAAMVLTGCYGKFALTKKVYDFNGSVHPNKIVQSVVMVGLAVIPVYWIAIVADGLILNSVEFWTGSNPMSSNVLEQKDPNGNQVTAIKQADGSMDMTFKDKYGVEAQMTLVKEGDIVKAMDNNGKVIAQADISGSTESVE